jgi:two-component sensor histidine kinase/HAMP domain-containing protein
MRFLRNVSIRSKLTVIAMFSTCMALLLAGSAFVVYDHLTLKKSMVRDLQTLADVIGSNCTAAITFDNAADAAETMSALRVEKHIIAACIYGNDGEAFAQYVRNGRPDDFTWPTVKELGHRFGENDLTMYRKIRLDNEQLGIIFLQMDLGKLHARLQGLGTAVALVVLCSSLIVLAVVSLLQRVISTPILRLADAAKTVSNEKDYSVRVTKDGQDEMGFLIDKFNEMLIQIQQRDIALQDARDRLEVRVKERTQELESQIAVRRQAEEALVKRDRILAAVSKSAHVLLKAESLDESFEEVGRVLGLATQASRVYVFQNEPATGEDVVTTQRSEWVAAGVTRQIDNPGLQHVPYGAAGFGRWKEELSQGRAIFGPVKEYPASEQALLVSQGILSLAVVPIFVDEEWWGFIGFDDCLSERSWSDAEIEAIRSAASVIGSALERAEAERRIIESLREKEVLLKEVHHRVKNNLQIITSLLNLQAGQGTDSGTQAMFRDSQGRVKSMALIHERLYRSHNLAEIEFSDYVESLTRYLLSTVSGSLGRISIAHEIDNIVFGVDTAVPCGLIINELVTNSLKYAFSDAEGGEIVISCKKSDNGLISLVIGDNGCGMPDHINFRKTHSLGMQLVLNLTEQLGGNIRLDREGGTTFTIEFEYSGPTDRKEQHVSVQNIGC